MAAKPTHHLLDVYSVWLHTAGTPKAWRKICRKIKSLDPAPDSLAYTSIDIDTETNMPHVSIFVDLERHVSDDTTKAALVETYAHESAHAAGMILDHFGQAYDGQSEAFGYLCGWIAQWLWTTHDG